MAAHGGGTRRRLGSRACLAGDRRRGVAHPHRPSSISRRIRRSPGNIATNYDAMPPLLRGRLDESKGHTPAAYDEARAIAHRARARWPRSSSDVDVLLTFSAPGAAPKGLASTGDARFNRLWTLMGDPLRQCSRSCRRRRIAGRRAGHRPIWRRRQGSPRRALSRRR